MFTLNLHDPDMTDFQISDEDLTGFKGKVAVVTGTVESFSM